MAAYGKLDVYWPNGPIENFSLEKPEIGVGRSSGNDIVLDTTTISRYHVTISHAGDQTAITDLDSINGTYIDGVRLAAKETRVLKGGEEIQIGDLRMIFQPIIVLSDKPTTSTPRSTAVMNTVEGTEDPTQVSHPPSEPLSFITALADAMVTVTPGAHNQTQTDIHNIGDKPTQYTIRVDGAPNGWVRLERSEFELDPNDRTSISISFKPMRRNDSRPGDYPLTIHVAEKDNPLHEIVEPLLLRVRDFSGFGIALAASHTRPDGSFEAYIHNQGNVPLNLTLTGVDPAGLFDFDIQPLAVTLAPGERQTVRGQVRLKHPVWTGVPRERRFDLIARAQNPSGFQAAVSGTFMVRARLPLWASSMLLPVVAGLGLIAVLALCGTLVVVPALFPSPTATATNTTTPTATATATNTAIPPTATASKTPSATSSATPEPTNTSTNTNTPTNNPTSTPTSTVVSTDTAAPSPTSTAGPTETQTATLLPTMTATYSPSPSATPTSSATLTPTIVPTGVEIIIAPSGSNSTLASSAITNSTNPVVSVNSSLSNAGQTITPTENRFTNGPIWPVPSLIPSVTTGA